MNENPLIILGALDAEIETLTAHMTDVKHMASGRLTADAGTLFGKKVVVSKSGVGKVFAAATTQWLIQEFNPAAVLFTGVAGALNPDFEVGDIVLATDCIQYDMDARGLGFPVGNIPYTDLRYFSSKQKLIDIAAQAITDHRVLKGRILTGDRFVTQEGAHQLLELRKELGGDAVEMEGAAVAQVCKLHEKPFLLIRTISDKANADSPVDFPRFLPTVAKNSFAIVRHLLEKI